MLLKFLGIVWGLKQISSKVKKNEFKEFDLDTWEPKCTQTFV